MGGAQTGTGKTAGFVLPLLQRLMDKPAVRDARGKLPIRALILTPTRELAAQVEESVRTYGKHSKLTSMVMFGGVGMQPQIDKLRRGVDILVATPGRLLDHHGQRTLDLSHVEIFVLDEADRMLDMGFLPDIKKVLAVVPAKKQSLLFSATFSDEIKALADRLLNAPVLIEVARRNQTADLVAQKVHPVGREMKKDLLTHLVKDNDWHQVLVFTRMKHGANRLVEHLLKQGISAMAIHGNKSQTARTKALADFKKGELQVLVATDIAARGIDIDQLPHVVNFEMPNVPEDYVHRIGRTGRAGSPGEAISLVSVDENGFLRDIERLIKHEIPKEIIPGFAPPSHERPEPIVLGRMVIGEGAGRGGARPRRDGPGRGDAGRSAHGGARGNGGGGGGGGNAQRPWRRRWRRWRRSFRHRTAPRRSSQRRGSALERPQALTRRAAAATLRHGRSLRSRRLDGTSRRRDRARRPGPALSRLLAPERHHPVTVLARKPLPATASRDPRLTVLVGDMAALAGQAGAIDDVYIALGTTIKVAGSEAAFRAVDFDLVVAIARAARSAGARRLAVVSALGADRRSRVFYNRVKGEMEEAVAALGYATVVIARPSLLLGDRAALGQPTRRGEVWAARLLGPLLPLVPAGVRPIEAPVVAAALVAALDQATPGTRVLSSADLQQLGRG